MVDRDRDGGSGDNGGLCVARGEAGGTVMKVFVVTTYAEYNWIIMGVFSSQDLANEYVYANGGPRELDVESFELDSKEVKSQTERNG